MSEEYEDRTTLELVDGELPVQHLEILPEPGYPVTVVIMAQGEDEAAAMDAIVLGHSLWLDWMDKADQLGTDDAHADARKLRDEDDSTLAVQPHYTQRAMVRRVRADVPTMAEWVRAQHVAQGGGGADAADRAARVADAQEPPAE
jgi:glycosyltransferase A (GT-A) superfamily protein (DUF2064 family)